MDNDDLETLIDDCLNRDNKLSEWEQNFLSEMHDRLINSLPISKRQRDIVEKIWEKVT